MRFERSLAVTIVLLLFGSGAVSSAESDTNTTALNKAITAARDICVRPSDYGFSVIGAVEAGGQIKVPTLLQKLFGNGISASVKSQAELSKGIPASERAASLKDYDVCASNVFAKVLSAFSLTDAVTGKPIIPPRSPAQYFANHGSQIGSNNVSVTLTGNGNVQIVSGGGAVSLVLPTPITAKNNRELTDGISQIMRAGMRIQERFVATDNVDEIKGLYTAWYNRADEYLSRQLDISYAAQFEVAPESGGYLVGHQVDGDVFYARITGKNLALSNIMTELRNK